MRGRGTIAVNCRNSEAGKGRPDGVLLLVGRPAVDLSPRLSHGRSKARRQDYDGSPSHSAAPPRQRQHDSLTAPKRRALAGP